MLLTEFKLLHTLVYIYHQIVDSISYNNKIVEYSYMSMYQLFNVFQNDCYVSPILSYASEVWGFHNEPDIENYILSTVNVY